MRLDLKKRHIKLTHNMVRAMLLMTSKEESRYVLSAIALRKDGYVYGTDGHLVGRVRVIQEDEDSLPVGLIPEDSLILEDAFRRKTEITDMSKTIHGEHPKDVKVEEFDYALIGKDELEQALKIKPGKLFPIEGIYVTWTAFGKPTITATRGLPDKVRFETTLGIEGRFPNIGAAWQDKAVGKEPSLALGGEVIEKLSKATLLATGNKSTQCIRIYLTGDVGEQQGFTVGNLDDDFMLEGVVMPYSDRRTYPAFEDPKEM